MATIKSTDDTYKQLIEENKIIIFDFFGDSPSSKAGDAFSLLERPRRRDIRHGRHRGERRAVQREAEAPALQEGLHGRRRRAGAPPGPVTRR